MTKYHRYILLLLAIVPAIAAPRDKADARFEGQSLLT